MLSLATLISVLPFPRGPGSRKKQGGEVVWAGSQEAAPILALLRTRGEALVESLSLSVTQFPHVHNGGGV